MGVVLLILIVPPIWVELQPRPPAAAIALPPLRSDSAYAVYVADWGYHTSITLQQPAGWALGPPGAELAPFVEWAWGEKRFYMESNYAPWSVFKTLFLPNRAVSYIAGRAHPPTSADGARWVYRATLTPDSYRALVVALERSIPRGPQGDRTTPFPAVPDYVGRFYPAYGAYLWWSDCNRWTVAVLHHARLATSGVGVILPGQVPARLTGWARQ